MEKVLIFDGNYYSSKKCFDDSIEVLKECWDIKNPTDDEVYNYINENIWDDLECEKSILDINIKREIVGLATFKSWNGYRRGAKRFSKNLSDILYIPKDCCIDGFSVSMETDVESMAYHHDGYYSVMYRAVKPGISDNTLHAAIMKWIENGDAARFMEITDSLVPCVCKIYGIVQEEREAV